jgi:hypothetical protein
MIRTIHSSAQSCFVIPLRTQNMPDLKNFKLGSRLKRKNVDLLE